MQTYDRALSSCPNYLEYEIAVLHSNIAACHIKSEQWKEAIDSATKSIEALERIDPLPKPKDPKDATKAIPQSQSAVEEIDDDTAEKIEALEKSGRTRDDVQKIRVKAFLRRAKARSETGGWAALQGAYEGKNVFVTFVLGLVSNTYRLYLPFDRDESVAIGQEDCAKVDG